MYEVVRYRLLNSAPEVVYDILKKHYKYECWRYSYFDDTEDQESEEIIPDEYYNFNLDNIELELYQLSMPLINLALAQYGSNIEVLNSLFYDEKVNVYRKACLNNFHFVYQKTDLNTNDKAQNELEKFLSELDEAELWVLIQNAGLHCIVLKRLYSRTRYFESLTQSDWEMLIYISSKNPSISQILTRFTNVEGGHEFSCIDEAWKLLDTVSVKSSMASALYHILKKSRVPANAPYEKWMKKWVSNQREGLKDYDEDKEYFLPLRVLIAKGSKIECRPYSDDLAVRCAYYTKGVFEDVFRFNKCCLDDGDLFLEYVCQNKSLCWWPFDVLRALQAEIANNPRLYRMVNKTLLNGKTIQDTAFILIKIDKYINEQKDSFREIKSALTGLVWLVIIISSGYIITKGILYILRDILHII